MKAINPLELTKTTFELPTALAKKPQSHCWFELGVALERDHAFIGRDANFVPVCKLSESRRRSYNAVLMEFMQSLLRRVSYKLYLSQECMVTYQCGFAKSGHAFRSELNVFDTNLS